MSRTVKVVLGIIVALPLVTGAYAQSLGDAARQNSKTQKPKASKVYTNEEIPSVVEPAQTKDAESSGEAKSEANSKPSEAKKGDEAKSADVDAESSEGSDEEKDAAGSDTKKDAAAEWKKKVSVQKEKVASIDRELQLTDREYKLRAAVFYSDAGARLRDDKKWADEERKYKDSMSRLQQDLTAAKEALDDVREDARKAGYRVD